jgi:hypothetical protein
MVVEADETLVQQTTAACVARHTKRRSGRTWVFWLNAAGVTCALLTITDYLMFRWDASFQDHYLTYMYRMY